MKVVLFGQNGQVASHLIAQKPQGVELTSYNSAQVDFSQSPAFAPLIDGADLVINASAYTAVDQAEDDSATAWAINATAVSQLATACAIQGARLFHISTDYCYPGTKPLDQAYVETDAIGPTGVYGASKLAGDMAVYQAQGFVFRTAWVYSDQGKNFVKTMLWLAENKDEVGIVSDQWGNPTAAKDIAHALWQASGLDTLPQPGVYHLAGAGSTSWHGFASYVFEALRQRGLKAPKVINALSTDQYPTKAVRPANSQLNCDKLEQGFGIQMPPWQQSVDYVIDQFFATQGTG